MTVERLRAAAALMRERALAAGAKEDRTAETWYVGHEIGGPSMAGVMVNYIDFEGVVVDPTEAETAEHIASWDPVVALAVADFLEGAICGCTEDCVSTQALAVANAYLGAP